MNLARRISTTETNIKYFKDWNVLYDFMSNNIFRNIILVILLNITTVSEYKRRISVPGRTKTSTPPITCSLSNLATAKQHFMILGSITIGGATENIFYQTSQSIFAAYSWWNVHKELHTFRRHFPNNKSCFRSVQYNGRSFEYHTALLISVLRAPGVGAVHHHPRVPLAVPPPTRLHLQDSVHCTT